MCNLFYVNRDREEIAAVYGIKLVEPFFERYNPHVVPRGLTPGMLRNLDGERELHPMQFALSPPRSKEPFDQKRGLNNARVESLDKWPWKLVVGRYRCIVPLNEFKEPCYWGKPAGKEVLFYPTDSSLLGVASIYNVWKSPGGVEKLVTMSFLMRPACDFVMDHGHHRQPFFLDPAGFDAWMEPGMRDTEESKQILREYAYEPELSYRVEREMAVSWKNRQKDRVRQRDEQLAAFDETGVRLGV